jgi:hypothetical protein
MEEVLQDPGEADSDCDEDMLFEKAMAEEKALEEKFLDTFMDTAPARRGQGRVLPTEFKPPPSETQQSLFPVGISRQAILHVTRFIHHNDPKTLLIYIHDACLSDGQEDPQGEWACVFRPLAPNIQSSVSSRL